MSVAPGARCGSHAEVAAVDVCQRCGRFLCGDCIELVREEVYCSSCAPRLNLPAAMLAKASLIVTFSGYAAAALFALKLGTGTLYFLLLVVVPGPVAAAGFTLAVVEWRRIKQGTSAWRGRPLVIASLVLAPLLFFAAATLWVYGATRLLHR
ncbi:MAG: hypothetical protein JNK82_10855 [Myxococcaceae bacterium]|nr:hypothetical protein [Myxococcaceae bacterium]